MFWALVVLAARLVFVQPPPRELEFVPIEPGTFIRGCVEGDSQCDDDEGPAHPVHLTKAFEIGKYEVTQAQWVAVMGNNPSRFRSGLNRPVERVSWADVQSFIGRMNAHGDGYWYRLPTEAEWEYAARAGTDTVYAGPSLDALGWYNNNANRQTHNVGQKAPNDWGLYDVHGNVSELVSDWWASATYARKEATDPQGPDEGELVSPDGGQRTAVRVSKGGSYDDPQSNLRISRRGLRRATVRTTTAGFRLVRVRLLQ